MKVATCIEWDYGMYDDVILPTEIEIPDDIAYDDDNEIDYDAISDYLSDVTGFCHKGYVLEDIDDKE